MLTTYVGELWKTLSELSLWLFFGASLAGLLKILLPDGFVSRHAGGGSWWNIVKTTLVGVPLPLCSCGVLPATIGLKKDGASNGSAVGFLISTPQTGVDSIFVTASFLGWPLALFKVLAALVTGLAGGFMTHWTEPKETTLPANPADKTCSMPAVLSGGRWHKFWNYTIHELIGGIYKYLAVGLLLAALISTLFPADALSRIPAFQGIWGMLIMLAFAVPMYVCTTGSVPIAASLVGAGLPLGSALVLLMGGPATNAATLVAVYRSFGKRITAIYLGTVIVGSMAFGLLFQSFSLPTPAVMLHPMHHDQLPWWQWIINNGAAAALVALMAYWSWLDLRSWLRIRFQTKTPAQTMTLQVVGMTCNNCVATVRRTLENLPQVQRVSVDLKTGRTQIQGQKLDQVGIRQAIVAAGYSIVES